MENNDAKKHATFSGEKLAKNLDAQSRSADSSTKSEMGGGSKRFSDWIRPNKDLLSIKLHFLLQISGFAALNTFSTLILRQRGISPEGIGLMMTIIPVSGVIFGSLLILLADFLRVHRMLFIISNLITPIALSGIYWTPHIMPEGPVMQTGNMTVVNNLVNATVAGSLGLPYDEKRVSNLYLIVADDIDQAFLIEDLIDNTILNETGIKQDVNINETSPCSTGELCSEKTEQQKPMESEKIHLIAEGRGQNYSTAGKGSTRNEASIQQLTGLPWFWAIVVFSFFFWTGFSVSCNLNDSICYMLLGNNGHLYGKQRLFGTIGWGICGLTVGALVDLYSMNLPDKDYFPAFVITAILCSLDIIVVTRMEIPVLAKEKKIRMMDLLRNIIHPKNALFFATVCVLSASMSIRASFFFLLVEDVGNAWNPEFKALKTIQGLIMMVRCYGGEILVFHYAGDIMTKVGIKLSFVLVILSHAVRYLLYYTITNPWFFLPIELLHGVYYGLFKATVTFHANELAPVGTTATMFTALKILMCGSKSLAGVTGGLLWSNYGGHGTFLAAGTLLLLYSFIYSTINFVFPWLFCRKELTISMSKPGHA